MEYAIRMLEIELSKIEETLWVIERYSVYPEYRETPDIWINRSKELKKSIEILKNYKEK